MVKLLYPQACTMTEAAVVQWAHDRMVDAALEEAGLDDPELTPFDDERVAKVLAGVPWPSLVEAMALLEDEGVATFGQ